MSGLLRVLYIDDEPDLREVAQIALELDPTIVVRCCGSGQEGLDAFPDWKPDLVLLDVMMPQMDGPTTLRAIRNLPGGRLPVVFISARASERDMEHLLACGAEGVIAKPFDPMQLAELVRSYVSSD